MYLFLIVFMPTMLVYYLSMRENKSQTFAAIISFIASVFFCSFKAFLSFSYRAAPSNFLLNYLYILFSYTLLPVCIVYAIYFIISKDDIQFRINAYFSVICAFFCVYLPYRILAGDESSYSSFELFFKPVLYFFMIALSSICIKYIYSANISNNKTQSTQFLIAISFFLLAPAAIETAWFIGLSFWRWLLLYAIYSFFSICAMINSYFDLYNKKGLSLFIPIKTR